MRPSADYLELWNPETDDVHAGRNPEQNLITAINGDDAPGYDPANPQLFESETSRF